MDVDIEPNAKKRVGGPPTENLPFAKRTKYRELFPSVFTSTTDVDINTLKIQNRELVSRITERTKAMENLSLQLTTAEQAKVTLNRNLLSFSSFMTQVIAELKALYCMLPGATSEVGANLDLLALFQRHVLRDNFEASDSLVSLRETLMQLVSSMANLVKTEVEERSRVIQMVEAAAEGAASATIKKLESEVAAFKSKRFDSASVLISEKGSNNLKLTESLAEANATIAEMKEQYDELLLRFKRLITHVSRLEIEMTELEEKINERPSASSSPAPMSAQDSQMTSSLGVAAPTSSENGTTPLSTSTTPSPEFQAAIAQAAQLTRELEEAKMLSESRLVEINALRDQKLQLIKSSSMLIAAPSAGDLSDLESDARVKRLIDHNRLLESESRTQSERIALLMTELKDNSEANSAAIKSMEKEHKRALDEATAKTEKSIVKFKTMEQDRDRLSHTVTLTEQLKAASLQHLPHVYILERQLEETKQALEKAKIASEAHVAKIALLETSEASAAEITRLNAEITAFKQEVAHLKQQLTQVLAPQNGASSNHAGAADLVDARATIETLRAKVKETEERLSSQVELQENLTVALTDMSTTTEKLALEVAEREKRIESLLKEKVNGSTLASASKRQSSIESAMLSGEKAKIASMESLLEGERNLSTSLKNENERLNSEILAMRTTIEHQNTVVTQSVIALDILRRRLLEMETQQKKSEEKALEALAEAEQERASRARVEEELSSTRRQMSTLKSSSSLTSSTGLSAGSSSGSSEDRLRKDLDLYKSLFNCTLCERKRQVNSIIIMCGHAFCSTCLDDNCIRPRNRRCPKCKTAFGKTDIKSIFF